LFSLANTDVHSTETEMVKNDPKEQVAHRVSKKINFFLFLYRKTLIAALVSILSKTEICCMFLVLLFFFLLYCSTQVLISASPWLEVLHFEIQSSFRKKKQHSEKPTKTPQQHTTGGKMGSGTVQLQQSGSAVVLPHPQILCIIAISSR